MDELEISTLGGLEIRRGGAPVIGFDSRKVEALLVYLVCTRRPQSRDVLADLLWDDLPQTRAMANLRVVLHSLRQQLAPFVEISRTTVAMSPERTVWLDAADLEEQLAGVRERGGLASAGAAETVEEAVALYRGDFLQGFHVRDCRGFEEWLRLEQERLRGLVVEALGDLVSYHLDTGAYKAGLVQARRLLELEPWLEAAHRGMMRLLVYSGQRAAALAQYEVCRQVLAQELGVEPEAETTALYQQILAGEVVVPAEAVGPPPHNLPPQPTPFVGREAVLAEIAERLEDPACRLLTLVGPGGSGKTRLALEAAAAQLERYTHGVFFVSLAPLNAVESIVPTVAEALDFTFYEGGAPEQQLLDYLRGKKMLLLMDNYEHLLEGAGLVSQILRMAPEVKVLAT
jgi:DNA-binding SARP family transcriptional activator